VAAQDKIRPEWFEFGPEIGHPPVVLWRTAMGEHMPDNQTSSGPIIFAVIGGAVIIAGAVLVNGCAQRTLQARDAETARIMQAINTDQLQAARNLRFLVASGMISRKDQSDKISNYLTTTQFGHGAALGPAVAGAECDRPWDAQANLMLEWLNIECGYWWPRYDGFDGPPAKGNIDPAKVKYVDRYGSTSGKFLSPAAETSASYGERSLPYDETKTKKHRYEVLKPVPAQIGKVAPWFDRTGGADQYMTEKPVQTLINDGFLKEVDPPK